ncbi:MAG TPA: helix-turn-helix domain-containing protein [Bacteroidia bacterium]
MNLKEKILKLLVEKNFTYTQLAEHLNITEKQLDHALETKTLEVRTLELISKELRIPLYSFFRDPVAMKQYMETYAEPYYNVNIWSDQEIKYKSEIETLKEQVENLRAELIRKEQLIEALEGQMKGHK